MRHPRDRPSIFDYTDYRFFLDAMCSYILKSNNEIDSFKSLSESIGFRSPNFIKLVIQGERNLSDDSIDKVISGLKLTQKESSYLEKLIRLDQAKSVQEKAKMSYELVNAKIHQNSEDIDAKHLKYLTEIHYITIREMVDLSDFVEDYSLIGKALFPRLRKKEVESAIKNLLDMGFLKRDDSGKLRSTQKPISTGGSKLWNDARSAALASLHKQMAKFAEESIEHFNRKERSFSGVTTRLSKEQYERVKEVIALSCKEILSIVNEEDSKSDDAKEVYRVNMQMFPLTQLEKAKKESKDD